METGIINIEMINGSKWNVFFENATQKNKLLQWREDNLDRIKEFEFTVKGIHGAAQFINYQNKQKTPLLNS